MIVCRVPEDTHKNFCLACIENGTTAQAVVAMAINRFTDNSTPYRARRQKIIAKQANNES